MNTTKYTVILLSIVTGSFLLIKSPLRDRFLSANIPPAISYKNIPVKYRQNPVAKRVVQNSPEQEAVIQNTREQQILKKERGMITLNYNRRPVVRGIVFRIQLLASKTPVPLNSLVFNGCGNVREYYENGLYKYTAGAFKAPRQSNKMFLNLETQGFDDSFLVAFKDDRPVKVKDAMKALKGY